MHACMNGPVMQYKDYICLQLTHEATSAMVPNITLAADVPITTTSIAIETSSEYCFHLSHLGRQVPFLTKNASLQFNAL